MEPRRKKIRAFSYTESDSSPENDPSSQNQNRKDNRHETELQCISGYESDSSSVESMDIIMYPSASALSKIQNSKSNSEKSESSERLSTEIEPKNELQSSNIFDYDSDNSSVESMDMIMYPSTSALSKTQNLKSNSEKSKSKDSNKGKLKDVPQKSFLIGERTKSGVSAKQLRKKDTFNERVKKLSRVRLSEIERVSSEIEPKNEVRCKVVKNTDIASKKIIKNNSIPIIMKGNRSPNIFQTSAINERKLATWKKPPLSQLTSNEKEELFLNKHEESNTAASRNFQDKMPDMSPTKKPTVKKRSEYFGSRLKGFYTDYKAYWNNRRISSEERKQRPTKAKNQCNIKDKNIEKIPKKQISSENPKSQSVKSDSCTDILAEVGKGVQSTSELMYSEGFNNTDKLGCSSNISHFPKNQTKGNTSNLENSNADREMNKTESLPCNSLQSQNKNPNESDEIIAKALYNNFLKLIKRIVDLDIKWLEEKENNVKPPPKLLEGAAQLPCFFYSPDEYSHRYLSMLQLEIWEKICFSAKANRNKKHNFEFSLDSYKYTYDLMQLDCTAAVHAPAENSLVIVQLQLGDGQLKPTLGFIEKLECKNNQTNERQHKLPKRQLLFKMFVKSRAVVPKIGLMKGKFVCSLYKEIKQAEALYKLCFMKFSPLLEEILEPSWNTFCTSYEQFYDKNFFNVEKNISDIVSREISLSPSRFKIMLLQGPPGSGKTRAILNIASNLLRHKEYFKKILIVAPNHFALDEIEKQLLKLNDLLVDSISFVRLGKLENIQRKFLDISRQRKCRMSCKDNYRSFNSASKTIDNMQQLDNEQQQMGNFLSDTSLILALPEDCYELRKYGVEFSCCLIDEVNQSTELDLLHTFALGISKFVLVADPMQLPSDVKSTTAMKYGYQRSIMDRFQSYFMRYRLKNPTIVLSHQYRINSSTAKFAFKNFYSDYPEISFSYADKRSTFYPLRPYVVLDDQCKYESKEKASGVNIIISLCSYIIDKHNASSIGIIVPSDEEQMTYQAAIKSIPELSEVEVKTVNHFQGQEKTVIILSCYHDFSKVVPFCSDYFRDGRKLNVALTRAISSLLICGPLYELKKYKYWEDIVTDARNRECYIRFGSVSQIQDILNFLNN